MRKTKIVRITDNNRDKGKAFFITEMGALPTENWALRAFLALAKSGVDIPSDIRAAGMGGLMTMGLSALAAGIQFEDAEPLLRDLLDCVEIMPSDKDSSIKRPLQFDPANPDGDDIQEVSTLLKLRAEVFNLHVDFSLAGAKLKSTSTPAPSPGSSTIPTSPQSSAL